MDSEGSSSQETVEVKPECWEAVCVQSEERMQMPWGSNKTGVQEEREKTHCG